MTISITLPLPDGSIEALALNPTGPWHKPTELLRSRKVYAAAHVTPKVLGNNTPGAPADIDWDSTLAFRRELWSWGDKLVGVKRMSYEQALKASTTHRHDS